MVGVSGDADVSTDVFAGPGGVSKGVVFSVSKYEVYGYDSRLGLGSYCYWCYGGCGEESS